MRILVTGGAGYIGPHTCVALLDAGHAVAILDNLSNSRIDVIERITRIAQRAPDFYNADVRDSAAVARLLGWQARFGLEDMCRDAWRWQSMNPQGYGA
ncbi:MAG: SDR family NAD(P)-dependent oxidoreductase [Gallionellaceae bacterium]|nr:MAG: SDR family NAD(P)-dependent oxidoreductase [Gallionellaceae bacterium]